MLPVEIDTSSRLRPQFNEEEKEAVLKYIIELIDEMKYVIYIQEFAAKQRASRRYNSTVVQTEMHKDDLVLIQVVGPIQ